MSQNIVNTRSPSGAVQVIAGWDRRLQELFCNVMPLDDEDEGDYSELLLTPSYANVEQLGAALVAAHIQVPQALLDAVQADHTVNAGNVMRNFEPDGKLISEHAWN